MKRSAPLIILVIGAAIAGVLLLRPSSDEEPIPVAALGSVPADARWVSESGSDSDPGTRSQPWQTLGRALESLAPGDTVVLASGTYGEVGETTVIDRDGAEGAPITIRGEPGEERPQILGAVAVEASYVRLDHLLLDGPTGSVKEPTGDNPRGEQVQLVLGGEDEDVRGISVTDSEIRDSDWHAGIFIAHAEDVAIVGNHIHHNGDAEDPAQENQSHGIYWDSGSGLVANNLIEGNVARGIQLYPEPSGVVVTHNTIVGNGRAGIQLGDEASGNLIVNNIVAFNGDRGIRSSSLEGRGNVARTNLAWDNVGVIEELGTGLTVTDTIAEEPSFSDAEYRLERDSPAVDRATPLGTVGLDRDGRSRPVGEASDIGAYESW